MAEKKYIRNYTVEQIVNEVPLYQKIYVSLEQTQSVAPYYQDLTRYNELLTNENRILSECVSCKQPLAFESFTKKQLFPLEQFMTKVVPAPYTVKPDEKRNKFNEILVKIEIHPEITAHSPSYYADELSNEYFSINYKCTLNSSHTMSVAFKLTGERTELSIMKIGQYPSIYEMNKKEISKYQDVLSKKDYLELATALQLYSRGVGVGSFVYLRRIYENLVEKEHIQQKENPNWNEEEYMSNRFVEKIKYLENLNADLIPAELSDFKAKIYSLLSEGIHSFDEVECSTYFNLLYTCIQLILDHSIEVAAKKKKLEEIRLTLANLPKK